ncbi:MAG: LuxR C-terminal-related transcriptional regulator, partial [Candidatus Promineifilaceae bacterium]
SAGGQATLEYLQQANLFTVPLDDERRWFRYHHLFAELLQQRLRRSLANSGPDAGWGISELHRRASAWYEANGFELEAFQHAAAANDIDLAARLLEGQGMPLHFRGVLSPVREWLASLPDEALNARPSLWVTYATVMTMQGQAVAAVEEKLAAAEAALPADPTEETRDLIGQIAAIRAMSAVPARDMETLLAQSQRALANLHPENLPVRAAATWALGLAYQYRGDKAAASETYAEAITLGEASGNSMFTLAALTSLAQIQETENKLHRAAENFERALALAGEPPLPVGAEAALGLARLQYEWDELDLAADCAQQALGLAQQMETVDTPAGCWALLARVRLARGDAAGAAPLLDEAERFLRPLNFPGRLLETAAVRVRLLLQQGDLSEATAVADRYLLPPGQARVYLARGDAASAGELLASWRAEVEARGEVNAQLEALLLQALACHAQGDDDTALSLLEQALTLAEPGGFTRLFLDEGPAMASLLALAARQGLKPAYTGRLLAAVAGAGMPEPPSLPTVQPLAEPLSDRELEVLQLVAEGLSNREIGQRLFLAVNTVKGHNRRIFAKLGVQRRTEAVARARELGLV